MHDPDTLAFSIKSPFKKAIGVGKTVQSYRRTLIAVWHRDPETDGSDDSCGWSTPRLTEADRKLIDEIVQWDLKFPYFSSESIALMSVCVNPKYTFRSMGTGDSLGHVAAAWMMIARRRDERMPNASEWWAVVRLATNPADNLRSCLVEVADDPERRVRQFFTCVMRAYLRHHRPWWKHPRWHFWHWRVQWVFLQEIRERIRRRNG